MKNTFIFKNQFSNELSMPKNFKTTQGFSISHTKYALLLQFLINAFFFSPTSNNVACYINWKTYHKVQQNKLQFRRTQSL